MMLSSDLTNSLLSSRFFFHSKQISMTLTASADESTFRIFRQDVANEMESVFRAFANCFEAEQ